jgi:hypothetical protein
LNTLGDAWYVGKLTYSLQRKNLQIISNIYLLITLTNPGVDITLFLKSLTSQLGFAQCLLVKADLKHCKFYFLSQISSISQMKKMGKRLSCAFLYCSLYLLIYLTICCMISL